MQPQSTPPSEAAVHNPAQLTREQILQHPWPEVGSLTEPRLLAPDEMYIWPCDYRADLDGLIEGWSACGQYWVSMFNSALGDTYRTLCTRAELRAARGLEPETSENALAAEQGKTATLERQLAEVTRERDEVRAKLLSENEPTEQAQRERLEDDLTTARAQLAERDEKLNATRHIISSAAQLVNPTCPDFGAYEDGHCSLIEAIQSDLTTANEKIAGLERDKERLDIVTSERWNVLPFLADGSRWFVEDSRTMARLGRGNSPREAIDAAIARRTV